MKTGMKLKGWWEFEIWRHGVKMDSWAEHNMVVYEGLDYALDAALSAGSAITAWYVGVFDDNHTVASGDTYATPGFSENADYDESTRPAWTDGGVSSQSVDNSASKASFTFNSNPTIYGAFLCGGGTAATTIGDAAGGGTLFCAVQFASGAKAVESGDVLKVTMTISAQDVAVE